MQMTSVTIRLPGQTLEKLKQMCQQRSTKVGRNVSISSVVRCAIKRLVRTPANIKSE